MPDYSALIANPCKSGFVARIIQEQYVAFAVSLHIQVQIPPGQDFRHVTEMCVGLARGTEPLSLRGEGIYPPLAPAYGPQPGCLTYLARRESMSSPTL